MKQDGPHGKYQEEHDARLIAALRNAAPQLLESARRSKRYLEALKEVALAEEHMMDRALRPGHFEYYVFGRVTIRVGCEAATDEEAECLYAEEVPNEHV
jgi:hypothetical protein